MKMNTREHERPDVRLGRGAYVHPTAILQGRGIIDIGIDTYIGPWCYLRGEIRIGDDCWIGPGCKLHGEGEIVIGEKVGVGSGVVMLTGEHRKPENANDAIIGGEVELREIGIGYGCDIGCNATILPGVLLAQSCQVGAGAVVTKGSTWPRGTTIVGNPARPIGEKVDSTTTVSCNTCGWMRLFVENGLECMGEGIQMCTHNMKNAGIMWKATKAWNDNALCWHGVWWVDYKKGRTEI